MYVDDDDDVKIYDLLNVEFLYDLNKIYMII